MDGIKIDVGNFRGKGVYATRNFKKGDVVVPYDTRTISREEYRELPEEEHAYVHSFYCRRHLFQGAARYVNHSKEPNTYQDLVNMADVASRDIAGGEEITTDGDAEIQNELNTFLEAYGKANDTLNFQNVAPFIADDAVFWFTNGAFVGTDAIRKEFEATWKRIQSETYTVSDIEWMVVTYNNAVRRYVFRSDGEVNSERQIYEGRGTTVLKRIDGNWQIVHEHLSTLK